MPSRRRFLAAAVAGSVVSVGCLRANGTTHTAFLHDQRVTVHWNADGHSYEATLFDATYNADGEPPNVLIAEEYDGIADGVRAVTVTDDISARLDEDFTDVIYMVEFCWEGDRRRCRRTHVNRQRFNELQFGDRVTIRVPETGTDIEIEDVREVTTVEFERWGQVKRFDFSQRHADSGTPLDDTE